MKMQVWMEKFLFGNVQSLVASNLVMEHSKVECLHLLKMLLSDGSNGRFGGKAMSKSFQESLWM